MAGSGAPRQGRKTLSVSARPVRESGYTHRRNGRWAIGVRTLAWRMEIQGSACPESGGGARRVGCFSRWVTCPHAGVQT